MQVAGNHRTSARVVAQQIQSYGSRDAVVAAAIEILKKRLAERKPMTNPSVVRDYLRLNLAGLDYETFWAFFLDTQNRVVAAEELFRGTLAQASVYPREVVKRALHHNAGAVIFAHNHPSGVPDPSHADENLTRSLKAALALVDVRVLDHFVIATGGKYTSFAERGLL